MPIIIGTLGPYMSASINPTRAPCLTRAHARFTATVDFPTPPLPLLIAMVCLTVGIRLSLFSAGPVPAAPAGLTSPIHFPFFSFPLVQLNGEFLPGMAQKRGRTGTVVIRDDGVQNFPACQAPPALKAE